MNPAKTTARAFLCPNGSYIFEFRPSWLLNGTTASVKGVMQRVAELFFNSAIKALLWY